jgi:hypothetical protein
MNISILIIGRTMDNIKFDSKRQQRFQINQCTVIIKIQSISLLIFVLTQQPKCQL